MDYVKINEYDRLYDFDPNVEYSDSNCIEERMFSAFLKQYGWEYYKDFPYNSGKHHIYVIINYEKEKPRWIGFLHALECDGISKRNIQEIHFLGKALFDRKVVFIHTIRVGFFFRRKGYARYMTEFVKQRFSEKADIMVEATKKGKKFWPAVGFIMVQKTPKGCFMIYPKGNK